MAKVFANVCFWDVFVIFWMQCFILQEMWGILLFVWAILGSVCTILKKRAKFWTCKQLKITIIILRLKEVPLFWFISTWGQKMNASFMQRINGKTNKLCITYLKNSYPDIAHSCFHSICYRLSSKTSSLLLSKMSHHTNSLEITTP